ncbi:SUR7/PalI family-domain-containing protein [Thermoascus aurantiacus ATCC 26904]
MAAGRVILSLLSMFFMAGAILLIFLTLLGGANNASPLNRIWFLQVNTGNIPGAPAVSRWTFWNICRVDNHGHSRCGSSHPAYPLDPPSHRNFHTKTNIPHQFIGTNHYFLMTRFMFAFILIGLFFAVLSFFLGLLALCTRIGAFLASLMGWIAWVFQVITTSLMTAAYVKARDHFNHNGQRARIGAKAFGFMWAAVACMLLSNILYCIGAIAGRRREGYTGRETRRRGFFGPRRNASARSRGSFANDMGASRKESYA